MIEAVYTGTRAPSDLPDGLRVWHVPMIAARPVEFDEDQLAEWTAQPAGIVVYSRNAVRALEAADAEGVLGPLDDHTWWAVGEKTADRLREALGCEARVPADQNFEGLRRAFADAELPDRVIALSLEGKDRDLSPVLADRGIAFEDVPVYRTGPVDHAPPFERCRAADWLVFASPRAVRVFTDLVADHDPGPYAADTRIAAIGPKTAGELRDRGFAPDFVPDEPSLAAIWNFLTAGDST